MNNKLGEIFYNGRIINFSSTNDQELETMYSELETSRAKKIEKIKNFVEQTEMRR